MSNPPSRSPKVFISYSWSSDEHTTWVADLGQQLMADGIDVVLDQWDLQDGQDLNSFMEQMVKDPDIKRVIIISDATYAAKADGRKGGVGTETQIISQEVYESVDQTKFVPILCERDHEGNPCLPIYLKGRKYIDLSNLDNEAEAYDQLIRNIYERPLRQRPALGKAPSHLFDDKVAVVSSAQRAKRFRDFVSNGKGNPSLAFDDFSEEFISNLEELRMTYSREEAATWCERIRANIQTATAHRDVIVDVVRAGVGLPSEQFMPSLLSFLERMLAFQEPPEGLDRFSRYSEDNYKMICYEMFLYVFSSFVKAKKYAEARQLIDHEYVFSQPCNGSSLSRRSYLCFNSHAISLEEKCAIVGNRKRYSVMADLIHDRANNKHIRFSDLLQADVLLWIASGGHSWSPRCLVHASSAGKCELFVRAVSETGYQPLRILLQMQTPEELVNKLSSPEIVRILQSEMFWHSVEPGECFNLDELKRRWAPHL